MTATTNRSAGLTLLEVLGVLATIAILLSISAPMVFHAVHEAKVRQAQATMRAIQLGITAFVRDTGRLPGQNEGAATLRGPGALPSAASAQSACTGHSARLADYLLKNPNYSGWRGPYLHGLRSDPWGRAFFVTIGAASTKPRGNVWILSAGPNGKCETEPADTRPQGDDIGLLVQRRNGHPIATTPQTQKRHSSAVTSRAAPLDPKQVQGNEILQLSPQKIAQVPPEQIAQMSAAHFAQLSAAQKAALTAAQLAERRMAERVRALRNETLYPSLPPSQIKYLTPDQIAGVRNDWWMGQLFRRRGKYLTMRQILGALQKNPAKVAPHLFLLTRSQLSQVPATYFSHIRGGWPIATLLQKRPSALSQIQPSQLASVQNPYWSGKLVALYGTQMTKAQLQAIDPQGLGGAAGALPASRLDWLTPKQRAAIAGHAVVQVLQKKHAWVKSMTPQQIASIANEPRAGWWYAQLPQSVVQSMSRAQIAAIPSKFCASIQNKLSVAQRGWCQ